MRQRTEAALALGVLAVLTTVAGIAGHLVAGPGIDTNRIPSTFLADPAGARALFDALTDLGIDTRRMRSRPQNLTHLADGTRQAFVLLAPDAPLSAPEARVTLQFGHAADLMLVGKTSEALMRCYGYRVEQRPLTAIAITDASLHEPDVHAVLLATHDSVYTDSSRVFDVAPLACHVPVNRRPVTLLASSRGAVAIRIDSANGAHAVVLIADADVLRNRTLSDSTAGVFALRLFAGRYDRVVFDEYHHGYGPSGSLAAATIAWSRQSPWGWMAWQLAGVGLIALLFGAIRFGRALPVIPRRRRSGLEHVAALATALSAARGHDQAIGAMVRGLRRRLAPPLLRARGDWRAWLRQLDQQVITPAQREAFDALHQLTQPGQPAASVLRAAHVVEDIWQNLHR